MKLTSVIALSTALLLSMSSLASADQQYRDETYNPPTNGDADTPDNSDVADEGSDFDEQLPGHRDETVGTTFDCSIGDLGGGWIDIFNVSAKKSPMGLMHIVLPDGTILDVELPFMSPGGNWAVELPYDIPADWQCQYTMTIISYPQNV